MKRAMIGIIFLLTAAPLLAQSGGKLMEFKVKKHHSKSRHTTWDKGIVTLDQNVDIVLSLENGTTAHIFCDWAQDHQSEGTGQARGKVRAVWEGLIIESKAAEWDLVKKEVRFFSKEELPGRWPGHLKHERFMDGLLEFDFDQLNNKMDLDDNSMMTATNAKGFWIPYQSPPQP